MSRLQIRAYRPIGQTDRWAMLGATESSEQIEQWLDEYSYKGVILHTGFSVLSRGFLVDLLPHARDGVVLCAATKALLPGLFDAKNIQLCFGMDEDGAMPLSQIDSWFFKVTPASEDDSDFWLVGAESKKGAYQQTINSQSNLNDLSAELKAAVEDEPGLVSDLLSHGITDIESFRANWTSLPKYTAFEVAKALMVVGKNRAVTVGNGKNLNRKELTDRAMKQCSAIVRLVRYLPPWDSGVPDTPVRLYNAMTGKGINTLYELENERAVEILKIPNLGKKSMVSLYDYLVSYETPFPDQFQTPTEDDATARQPDHLNNHPAREAHSELEAYELQVAPSLADLLDSTINHLQEEATTERKKRSFGFLKRRFAGDTLEFIAEGQGITRERIRQITDKSVKQISSHLKKHTDEEPLQNLRRLLRLAKELYSKDFGSHVDFSNFVRIFSQRETLDLSAAQRRMLEKLSPEFEIQFIPFYLASNKVVLPVTAQHPTDLDASLELAMKNLLGRIHGMETGEAEAFAKRQFLSILDSDFLASVLAVEAVLYRSSIDESGIVWMIAEKMGTENAVDEIVRLLRVTGRPMHAVDEIYPSMPQIYRDSVNFRRVAGQINEHQERCAGTSPDFIFTMGRGRYALWEHFDISPEHGKRCAEFIEQYVNEHTSRQFTDNDLYRALNKEGLATWEADHVDRHRIVSAILMRYRPSRVRYLGRFVWAAGAWTDQSDTANRYQIHELIEECIKEKGQPVSKKYLDDYISKIRGRGINDQYHEQNGLVRLAGTGRNALYWHESLDPIPYESSEVTALRNEIMDLVDQSSSSGIFMSGLKADVVKHSDIVSQYNPAQFLALLLRMPEVRVIKNTLNQLVVTMEKDSADT